MTTCTIRCDFFPTTFELPVSEQLAFWLVSVLPLSFFLHSQFQLTTNFLGLLIISYHRWSITYLWRNLKETQAQHGLWSLWVWLKNNLLAHKCKRNPIKLHHPNKTCCSLHKIIIICQGPHKNWCACMQNWTSMQNSLSTQRLMCSKNLIPYKTWCPLKTPYPHLEL